MKCPKCQSNTIVTDSRYSQDNSIRRRRECEECSFRFTTYERDVSYDPFAEKDLRIALELLDAVRNISGLIIDNG